MQKKKFEKVGKVWRKERKCFRVVDSFGVMMDIVVNSCIGLFGVVFGVECGGMGRGKGWKCWRGSGAFYEQMYGKEFSFFRLLKNLFTVSRCKGKSLDSIKVSSKKP